MWTKRERVITNSDEAIDYIESKECLCEKSNLYKGI